jgi:hypothetical protein
MTPLLLASYTMLGHFDDPQLFSPGVTPELRVYELAGRMEAELTKRQATIAVLDGVHQVVQAADPSLLLLVDGQPVTVRQLADAAMGTSPALTTQAVEVDQSAFRKQLSQSMENQGMQALPNSTTPLEQTTRYLEPFRRQLSQSIADQQKNQR